MLTPGRLEEEIFTGQNEDRSPNEGISLIRLNHRPEAEKEWFKRRDHPKAH